MLACQVDCRAGCTGFHFLKDLAWPTTTFLVRTYFVARVQYVSPQWSICVTRFGAVDEIYCVNWKVRALGGEVVKCPALFTCIVRHSIDINHPGTRPNRCSVKGKIQISVRYFVFMIMLCVSLPSDIVSLARVACLLLKIEYLWYVACVGISFSESRLYCPSVIYAYDIRNELAFDLIWIPRRRLAVKERRWPYPRPLDGPFCAGNLPSTFTAPFGSIGLKTLILSNNQFTGKNNRWRGCGWRELRGEYCMPCWSSICCNRGASSLLKMLRRKPFYKQMLGVYLAHTFQCHPVYLWIGCSANVKVAKNNSGYVWIAMLMQSTAVDVGARSYQITYLVGNSVRVRFLVGIVPSQTNALELAPRQG